MESSDPVDTPMVEKSKLDEDTQGKVIDPTHYRGMVGTLMYLTANADHASCQDTRQSTSGCMQLLGDRLVSWSSKRQKSTAISSTEAKYNCLLAVVLQSFGLNSHLPTYGLGFNKIPMNKTAYTSYSSPHGIIYVDQYKKKRLMRTDELHKFSDGTLNDVRSALHDIVAGIRMEYLPMRKWSNLDKKRARVMVQDIDK
ncbi:hypothetical protein Tco_0053632 [Tanacetum coccineum]